MTKAPLGGAGTGANPTDRSKKSTKRSLLNDAKGILLSVVTDGANRHDKMLVKQTLDAIIYKTPSLDDGIQNMCLIRNMIILISDNWLKIMVTLLTFGAVEKKI
jgi:putative transposase